ncbi:MAG: neutral zinc metallopeptidase [Hyphomicrobiaceae bacterium]
MRYDDKDRESENVEDRRQEQGSSFPGGPRGGMPFPMPGGRKGGMSLMTILLVVGFILLTGGDLGTVIRTIFGGGPPGLPGGPSIPQQPRFDPGPGRQTQGPGMPRRNPFELPGSTPDATTPRPASGDDMARFVRRVLADTEDVWDRVFQSVRREYRKPKLVLFTGSIRTGCGTGLAQMGPFYCPLDQKIYIDLSFYEELKRRFQAPGDFAQAYVIAHEVGHHVQMLLGIAQAVQERKARMSQTESNALQVRMELQADCFAGVWAHLTDQLKRRLEPGDIEEGLNAASAIGDDMIQRRTQGHVVPEAFTHGSSAQRVRWFKLGFDQGRMQACDTFNIADP